MDDAIILPVILLATVACMALGVWSDMRIGRARLAVKRGRADAPPLLAARQGAAAAFRSNALFVLLMLGLLELAGVASLVLAVGASVFVAARMVLIADSDNDRGLARSAAVILTLATQMGLAVSGVAVAIG